jgi:hypothetical protein
MSADFRLHGTAGGRIRTARPKPQPVSCTVVHPAVLAEALRLAGGDAARLRVLSADTVLVINHPRGPRRR